MQLNSIKIFHIVHIDNLTSIIDNGFLFSDAEMRKRPQSGIVVGMNRIKNRRLALPLTSHENLNVGECVPFYFCPRSIMLYMFKMNNHSEIEYRGGQQPILHLVADLHKTADWADANNLRWAFTNSSAGSRYFEDYADFANLYKIDWKAVNATQWSDCQDKKQAEFLIEHRFPWELIEEIGVYSDIQQEQARDIIEKQGKKLQVKIKPEWYYK